METTPPKRPQFRELDLEWINPPEESPEAILGVFRLILRDMPVRLWISAFDSLSDKSNHTRAEQ